MISSLSGKISVLSADALELRVSGVGYAVAITSRHSLKLRLDQELTIATKLIVREDDMALFGFESSGERDLFELLCSVSGIGPKLAMTVLSGLEPAALRNAVNSGNESVFRAVSGIGPKTAKLILISLAGKVGLSSTESQNEKVLAALLQLGTDEAKAREILQSMPTGLSDSETLKAALAKLGSSKLVGNA